MTCTHPGKFTPPARRVLSVLVGLACATSAWAQDADIVMLVGPGEVRSSEPSAWIPARVTQKLGSGSFVRTGPDGQMALLLRDQTQLRLNQNTTLQIRSLQAGSDATVLSLTQGRLWAQVKQIATDAFRVTAGAVLPNRVRIITPTATVGIRGTDWELVVGDRGITTLTVVSGEVEMSNEFGRVSVGANEQAVAEAGKAPVKSLLSSARDRVQWVTAYRPAPARWVPNPPAALQAVVRDIEAGAYSKAVAALEPDRSPPARLLLADVYIYLGRTADAVNVLAPLSQAGRGDPAATTLHGRALLIAGRLDEAANWLLASNLSLSARYHYADSQNTGADFLGLKVPYIPRHLANALVYWQPANRWQLIARATYRSSRFTDEANLERLAAGWNYGVAANWESADKRLNVQAALLNIRANKQSSADLRTVLALTGIYRF